MHKLAREERLQCSWASLAAQLVKNLPATWETWVWSSGWEDPLEKGKATHSSILAWKILWTIWSIGSQRVGRDWATFTWQDLYYPIGLLYCFHFFFFLFVCFNLTFCLLSWLISIIFSFRSHIHFSALFLLLFIAFSLVFILANEFSISLFFLIVSNFFLQYSAFLSTACLNSFSICIIFFFEVDVY